jgi:hypothetical protein
VLVSTFSVSRRRTILGRHVSRRDALLSTLLSLSLRPHRFVGLVMHARCDRLIRWSPRRHTAANHPSRRWSVENEPAPNATRRWHAPWTITRRPTRLINRRIQSAATIAMLPSLSFHARQALHHPCAAIRSLSILLALHPTVTELCQIRDGTVPLCDRANPLPHSISRRTHMQRTQHKKRKQNNKKQEQRVRYDTWTWMRVTIAAWR